MSSLVSDASFYGLGFRAGRFQSGLLVFVFFSCFFGEC